MSASTHSPLFIEAADAMSLAKMILKLQGIQGGRVQVISIYFDGTNHVCWYYPVKYQGHGVM